MERPGKVRAGGPIAQRPVFCAARTSNAPAMKEARRQELPRAREQGEGEEKKSVDKLTVNLAENGPPAIEISRITDTAENLKIHPRFPQSCTRRREREAPGASSVQPTGPRHCASAEVPAGRHLPRQAVCGGVDPKGPQRGLSENNAEGNEERVASARVQTILWTTPGRTAKSFPFQPTVTARQAEVYDGAPPMLTRAGCVPPS